jgi:ABC-type bacteriocin/lantibiotic exporter with double-glycine peptidase domain
MTELEFAKRIIFREYPGAMLVLVFNELLGAGLVLIGLGTLIPFVGGLLGGSKELPGPIGEFLAVLGLSQWSNTQILGLLVALLFARILLDGIRMYLAGWIGVKLGRTIMLSMNNALAETDLKGFSKINQGKFIQCMVTESSFARGAVNDLASGFAYGLITLLLITWMAIYSLKMFLLLVMLGGIFMWTNRRLMMALRQCSQQRIELMSQTNTKLVDIQHIFKMLLAENLLVVMGSAINSLINRIASTERRQLILSVLFENYIAIFGLLILMGATMAHFMASATSGSLLLFDLILLQRVTSYFGNFQVKRKAMLQKIPSYEACLEMMRLGSASRLVGNIHSSTISFDKEISVENASFSYEEDRPILKNVSVQLPDRGIIYFIGPSGSGKTTLVDLIIGLLPPKDGGRVLIDGEDLKEFNLAGWSRFIAYVPQEAYIPSGRLRDYLTFGTNNVPEAKIWQALRHANADRIVGAQLNGLDTIVRPGGSNFSGGERHRLSIARALIREVKVLFLDEPSSALDKDSAMAVFDSLQRLAQEMLVVVVTHSREVIRGIDRVYLFDEGEIAWSGSYAHMPEKYKTE